MTTKQSAHEWWRDLENRSEQREFLKSYRAAEHERIVAGWRRLVMCTILAIGVPVLVRLVSTL